MCFFYCSKSQWNQTSTHSLNSMWLPGGWAPLMVNSWWFWWNWCPLAALDTVDWTSSPEAAYRSLMGDVNVACCPRSRSLRHGGVHFGPLRLRWCSRSSSDWRGGLSTIGVNGCGKVLYNIHALFLFKKHPPRLRPSWTILTVSTSSRTTVPPHLCLCVSSKTSSSSFWCGWRRRWSLYCQKLKKEEIHRQHKQLQKQ